MKHIIRAVILSANVLLLGTLFVFSIEPATAIAVITFFMSASLLIEIAIESNQNQHSWRQEATGRRIIRTDGKTPAPHWKRKVA